MKGIGMTFSMEFQYQVICEVVHTLTSAYILLRKNTTGYVLQNRDDLQTTWLCHACLVSVEFPCTIKQGITVRTKSEAETRYLPD